MAVEVEILTTNISVFENQPPMTLFSYDEFLDKSALLQRLIVET